MCYTAILSSFKTLPFTTVFGSKFTLNLPLDLLTYNFYFTVFHTMAKVQSSLKFSHVVMSSWVAASAPGFAYSQQEFETYCFGIVKIFTMQRGGAARPPACKGSILDLAATPLYSLNSASGGKVMLG
jgi:hypothetical protein